MDNSLKDRVKKFLETERISNSEFAEIAGVSGAYVNSIKKNLSFEILAKLYSLKDSGITKMISMLNVSEVRDQARHSNIAITDVYTDRSKANGNEHIKCLDFSPTM